MRNRHGDRIVFNHAGNRQGNALRRLVVSKRPILGPLHGKFLLRDRADKSGIDRGDGIVVRLCTRETDGDRFARTDVLVVISRSCGNKGDIIRNKAMRGAERADRCGSIAVVNLVQSHEDRRSQRLRSDRPVARCGGGRINITDGDLCRIRPLFGHHVADAVRAACRVTARRSISHRRSKSAKVVIRVGIAIVPMERSKCDRTDRKVNSLRRTAVRIRRRVCGGSAVLIPSEREALLRKGRNERDRRKDIVGRRCRDRHRVIDSIRKRQIVVILPANARAGKGTAIRTGEAERDRIKVSLSVAVQSVNTETNALRHTACNNVGKRICRTACGNGRHRRAGIEVGMRSRRKVHRRSDGDRRFDDGPTCAGGHKRVVGSTFAVRAVRNRNDGNSIRRITCVDCILVKGMRTVFGKSKLYRIHAGRTESQNFVAANTGNRCRTTVTLTIVVEDRLFGPSKINRLGRDRPSLPCAARRINAAAECGRGIKSVAICPIDIIVVRTAVGGRRSILDATDRHLIVACIFAVCIAYGTRAEICDGNVVVYGQIVVVGPNRRAGIVKHHAQYVAADLTVDVIRSALIQTAVYGSRSAYIKGNCLSRDHADVCVVRFVLHRVSISAHVNDAVILVNAFDRIVLCKIIAVIRNVDRNGFIRIDVLGDATFRLTDAVDRGVAQAFTRHVTGDLVTGKGCGSIVDSGPIACIGRVRCRSNGNLLCGDRKARRLIGQGVKSGHVGPAPRYRYFCVISTGILGSRARRSGAVRGSGH